MYFVMFISHIIKTVEYFAVAGFPEIPLEQLPAAVQAVIFNAAKLASIYFAML